jgi:hypothetical protein
MDITNNSVNSNSTVTKTLTVGGPTAVGRVLTDVGGTGRAQWAAAPAGTIVHHHDAYSISSIHPALWTVDPSSTNPNIDWYQLDDTVYFIFQLDVQMPENAPLAGNRVEVQIMAGVIPTAVVASARGVVSGEIEEFAFGQAYPVGRVSTNPSGLLQLDFILKGSIGPGPPAIQGGVVCCQGSYQAAGP